MTTMNARAKAAITMRKASICTVRTRTGQETLKANIRRPTDMVDSLSDEEVPDRNTTYDCIRDDEDT